LDFLNYPVFICGAPRSGTTLLSNLLDGHSNLMVLPNETHILKYLQAYKGEAGRSFFLRDYLFTEDVLLYTSPDYVEKTNQYLTGVYGAKAAWRLPSINGETFAETYSKFLKENGFSLETVYKAVAVSLFASCSIFNQSTPPEAFVEKRPLDNEISAVTLKEHFPRAKFVHILRDPRTRYVSAKKRRIGKVLGFKYCPRLNGKDFARGHAEISMMSFALAERNKSLLGDDCLIIKYEDLTSQPEKTMKMVAAFLSLPWEDILLSQTRLGEQISSASSFKTVLKGITATNTARLKTYNSLTSALERKVVNLYNQDLVEQFGYSLDSVKPLRAVDIIRPLRYELPFHYLGTRLSYLKQVWGRTSIQLTSEAIHQILSRWESGIPIQD